MSVIGGLGAVALFYVGATALGAAVAVALAVGALRRRSQPAAPQFALLNLDVAGWCATTVLLRLDVLDTKVLWNLNNVFIFAFIFTWFAFVLAYTGRREWLWKPPTMVLWAIPTAGAVVSFVPSARHVLVVAHAPETVAGVTVVPFAFTAVGATLLVGFFALDLLAFGLLVDLFRRSRSPYRRQVGAIIAGRVIALATALVFYVGLSHHELSFIPVAYAVQGVVIGWALFRYDLLDIAPLVADTIVTQMSDAVVVVDADGRVADCNPALARLVGGEESASVGRDAEAVLPGLTEAVETDGTIEVTPAEREGAREGPRERIYEPEATALHDHHDAYRGRVVVLRDVTLQRTREETLEAIRSATEAFLDASDPEAVAEIAVETAQDGLEASYSVVALYDEETDRLEPTALAAEFEAALHEAGVEPNPSVPSEPLDREGRAREVFETGTAILGESFTLGRGESTLTVPTGLVLPLGDHGVVGVGKARGDVGFDADEVRTARTLARSTETALDRLERERELAASSRALEERTEQLRFFNGALRHDLRNAIAVIEANLDFVAAETSPEGREHLDTVSEWVRDIDDLVDTVGSITRTITDEEDHTHSTIGVSAEVERRVAKVADGHDALTVEMAVEDDLTAVGDDLFGEVVENLLLNAIEHNDNEEPRIEVTAERRGETVEIRVADDGPGIPEEFRDSVFEAGVTAENSGSIGFGLYFVKVMTEAYGGSVRFEANEPRGTVAVVTLPAADADGNAVEARE